MVHLDLPEKENLSLVQPVLFESIPCHKCIHLNAVFPVWLFDYHLCEKQTFSSIHATKSLHQICDISLWSAQNYIWTILHLQTNALAWITFSSSLLLELDVWIEACQCFFFRSNKKKVWYLNFSLGRFLTRRLSQLILKLFIFKVRLCTPVTSLGYWPSLLFALLKVYT